MYMHVYTEAVYRSSQYANMSNVYVQFIRNCVDLLVFSLRWIMSWSEDVNVLFPALCGVRTGEELGVEAGQGSSGQAMQ